VERLSSLVEKSFWGAGYRVYGVRDSTGVIAALRALVMLDSKGLILVYTIQ
jgi:hypothetical protein